METVKNVEYTKLSGISVLDVMITPDIDENALVAIEVNKNTPTR